MRDYRGRKRGDGTLPLTFSLEPDRASERRDARVARRGLRASDDWSFLFRGSGAALSAPILGGGPGRPRASRLSVWFFCDTRPRVDLPGLPTNDEDATDKWGATASAARPRTLKMRSLGTELLIDVIDLATDLG